jgi:hypothetical protein
MTPEDVERERQLVAMARAKMGDTSPVGHWTQGATRVVDALGAVMREKRTNKAEAAGLAGADDRIAAILSGQGGGFGGSVPSLTLSTAGQGAPGMVAAREPVAPVVADVPEVIPGGPMAGAVMDAPPVAAAVAANPSFFITPETRAVHRPSADMMNISMDFNASPGGGARGTEVIIPDNATPEMRAAAEAYNVMVADFARAHGIADYPVRGVRTRSENGRGVGNTVHLEPFFKDDLAMQEAIAANPAAFAELKRQAFGGLNGVRLVAPHGVGGDRGAASSVFGDETSYGELMANTLLGNPNPTAPRSFAGVTPTSGGPANGSSKP